MKCPDCQGRYLSIEVSFRGMVPCTFGTADDVSLVDGASLDSEWDESSRCECLICGWMGTLKEAGRRPPAGRRPAEPAPRSTPAARIGLDLEQIRRRLDVAPCPPTWKPQIEALVTEVERLRGLIDVMARVTKVTRKSGRAASEDDTVIG